PCMTASNAASRASPQPDSDSETEQPSSDSDTEQPSSDSDTEQPPARKATREAEEAVPEAQENPTPLE
ncbi:hypothetical protein FOMPIDRAFT_1084680, partial [Fomitopsis schrenkii]